MLSNGDLLEHGDFITLEAYTSNTNSWKTLYGVASITPKTPEFNHFIVHLCHDDENYVGEMSKGDKFGYKNGWVFYIKMNGDPIDTNLIRNIKKLESGAVFIGGQVFRHGDRVVACVDYNDEHVEINDCRLSIRFDEEEKGLSSRHLYLSQNDAEGDNVAREDFGYSLGWSVTVSEGKITSCDTYYIKHLDESKVKNKVKQQPIVDEYYDDDPMPMDWVMEEKIPDDL